MTLEYACAFVLSIIKVRGAYRRLFDVDGSTNAPHALCLSQASSRHASA